MAHSRLFIDPNCRPKTDQVKPGVASAWGRLPRPIRNNMLHWAHHLAFQTPS